VYFSPVVFDGKDLPQGDVTSALGWGKDLRDYHEETGDYAFWSNAMFGGMPANYTYMPATANIFKQLSHAAGLYLPPLHVRIVFLYLIGFYIFLIALGCRPWLSIIGAVAYAFASYNFIIIDAGHVNKGLAMALMAPILGGVILTYRKKYLWGILVTLIAAGIHIYYNHQQITYYLLLMIIVAALVYLIYAIRENTLKDYLKSSGILAVAAILASLPTMGNLIPTIDYTKETMRGGAVLQVADGQKESSGLDINYAFQWSYGVGETMTLLIPNFYGASSHYNVGLDSHIAGVLHDPEQRALYTKYAPTYWGDQPFTSGPVYVGAIICFLFVLGLLVVRGPEKWWLLITVVISVFLSWGKNFAALNDFLFYHLPLYSKFRTPSMALVIAGVSMAALAVLAIKTIMENKDKKNFKNKFLQQFYTAIGITGGICFIFALFGGSIFNFSTPIDGQYNYPDWFLSALYADRAAMLTSDAWRSLLLIAVSGICIWLFVQNKMKIVYFLLCLAVLILVDLWGVNKRFLGNDNFVPKRQAKAIMPTAADQAILQDKDPNYRVMNLAKNTFNESQTSYFHKSIGGYSPAKLRRYQDIIDYHLSQQPNIAVLNMLNTRYFIVPTNQGTPEVQYNSEALGNCWFVDNIEWVNNPNEEIAALDDFDPATTAIVDIAWKQRLPDDLAPITDDEDEIYMISYKPGNIVYESVATAPHLAVFSEVFYKTWKAYIDGQEIPIIRVNYILRALPVPAGEHTIEFKCVDKIFNTAARISLFSSILVGLVLLGLIGYIVKREVLDVRRLDDFK
ncbi:MAG: YfhO family protein, partial [Prevotellaceae bacterium]|nr:YfhO family protein [Prevotellaceae bacterium]